MNIHRLYIDNKSYTSLIITLDLIINILIFKLIYLIISKQEFIFIEQLNIKSLLLILIIMGCQRFLLYFWYQKTKFNESNLKYIPELLLLSILVISFLITYKLTIILLLNIFLKFYFNSKINKYTETIMAFLSVIILSKIIILDNIFYYLLLFIINFL